MLWVSTILHLRLTEVLGDFDFDFRIQLLKRMKRSLRSWYFSNMLFTNKNIAAHVFELNNLVIKDVDRVDPHHDQIFSHLDSNLFNIPLTPAKP